MKKQKKVTTNKTQLVLLVIGSILFNWFFWKEELGLNLLLYNIFIIGATLLIYPKIKTEKRTLLMICASLFSAFMVFAYGSSVAKLTNFTSLLIFIGYAHQPQIKSIFYAGFTAVINFFHFPIKQFVQSVNEDNPTDSSLVSTLKKTKLIIVPAISLFIFYWIFKIANPKFD